MTEHRLWKWRGFLALGAALAVLWFTLRLIGRLKGGNTQLLQIVVLGLGLGAVVAVGLAWGNSILQSGRASESRQNPLLGWLDRGWKRVALLFRSDAAEAHYQWALASPYADRALEHMEEAARRGHREAHFELGLFQTTRGMGEAGRELALRHFRRAAELGHAEAAFHLAEGLRWGAGDRKDRASAHAWYLQSAHRGCAAAMAWLAQAFQQGDGVEPDAEAAALWRKRHEALGVVPGLRTSTLGKGDDDTLQRVGEAVASGWNDSRAALEAQPGFPAFARVAAITAQVFLVGLALFLFLITFLYGGLFAIPGFLALAGLTMLHFKLRKESAYSRATRHMMEGAEKGEAEASYKLGMAFLRGQEQMPQDLLEAARHFQQAAEQGHLAAMIELAELQCWGPQGLRNPEQGRAWLQQAADRGHAEARLKLSRLSKRPEL
ncbi:MAG: sel1 repeat family protein [Firmicutes bacterium]|nr:sel1 repeat family protein [Bacillota bacterium]